jgi:hypothetical protein
MRDVPPQGNSRSFTSLTPQTMNRLRGPKRASFRMTTHQAKKICWAMLLEANRGGQMKKSWEPAGRWRRLSSFASEAYSIPGTAYALSLSANAESSTRTRCMTDCQSSN